MAEELGKIEKPEAKSFKGKRKLYIVPLLFSADSAPAEYVEKYNLYWEQARQHVANLESKTGKINHVYHESIALTGDEGLNLMEKLNPPGHQITTEKCQAGDVFEVTEDKELTEEAIDWERFLLAGFVSQKVANKVSEFYMETLRKRYQYITDKINETLKSGEAGMLMIREGHMVQFPQDIEVFAVAPPVLDEIHRWQRDRQSTAPKEETE